MALPEPRALLEQIAGGPRPAGSGAEREARARCRAWLEELQFRVEEQPFAYSAFPGRWGTPIAGVLSIAALAALALLAGQGRPGLALVLIAGGVMVATLAGRWTARHGVLDLPLLRREGVNLHARRGEPAVWLVAHLDSKSQPVPIGLRALGIMATVVVWTIAAGLLLAQWLGAGAVTAWPVVLGAGVLAGLPVVLTTVGEGSDGAVDNASGVAAILHAAALLPPGLPLGLTITSAEELGLAGARAWARGTAPAVALNVDGVDDTGDTVAMYSGARPERVCRALARVQPPVRCRRLLPGILTDGVALADAGWEVVTVSRGTRGTLGRIHSARDDLQHLHGSGVSATAALLAGAASELTSERTGRSGLGVR